VEAQVLEYRIEAKQAGERGATATSHGALVDLDTTLEGKPDAFNPVELLLAALAACMLKGIERSIPVLKFELRSASVRLHAARQDSPPLLTSIDYELVLDTDEPDRRLDLLHRNVIKYGTISNTLGAALTITGKVVRAGR
jgi:uncharacterized OsmC-like protein